MIRVPAGYPADDRLTRDAPVTEGELPYQAVIKKARQLPGLLSAIQLASPTLAAAIDGAEKMQLPASKERRAAMSIIKYDLRMRNRPTPFGLFAGVGIGRYGKSAEVTRSEAPKVHGAPDMEWLLSIVDRLQTDPEILVNLQVRCTNLLEMRGDRVYLDAPPDIRAGAKEPYTSTVRIRRTPVIDDIIDLARNAISVRQLINTVTERHGGRATAAMGLISSLISRGILLSSLQPSLNDDDPLATLLAKVKEATKDAIVNGGAQRDIDALACANQMHMQLASSNDDGSGIGAVNVTRAIRRSGNSIGADLSINIDVVIPHSVREDASRAIDLMWRLSPARLGMRSLRQWHSAFLERYGVDRQVPLSNALDPAVGLGAPAGYEWPPSEVVKREEAVSQSEPRRNRILLALVAEAQRKGLREVVLEEETLDALTIESPAPELAQRSCELYAMLAATSRHALNAGDLG